jgi:Flp pilus assembly protein TadD
LEVLGEPVPADLDGVSLTTQWTRDGADQGAARAVYFETLFPLLHYNWSDLRGVVSDGLKLIRAPQAELYDLAADSAERKNLAADRPQDLHRLETLLNQLLETEAAAVASPVDAEVAAKLRALGYGGGEAAGRGDGAVRPDPKERVEVYKLLQRAADATASGRDQDAAAMLREVLQREPDLPDAHQALGDVLLALGRPSQAVAECREVVRLRPRDSLAYMNLGLALEAAADPQAGAESLEQAVELDPHNSQALYNLARIHFEARRWRPAAEFLQRAIASDSNLRTLLPDLGRAWLELGELDRAESVFHQAVAELGDRPGLHLALGEVREARGDFNAAIAEYEQAQRGAPKSGAVLRALARVLERRGGRGDLARAEKLRAQAAELD